MSAADVPRDHPPEQPPPQRRGTWVDRRREKIVDEIRRNRAGGHRVPTWALTLILLLIVGVWAALVVLS